MSCYYSGRITHRPRSVILLEHRYVKIPIPRPFATVTVTCARVRNIVCRRYTNITRVILTRVIFNPGQNGASVDAALDSITLQLKFALFWILVILFIVLVQYFAANIFSREIKQVPCDL